MGHLGVREALFSLPRDPHCDLTVAILPALPSCFRQGRSHGELWASHTGSNVLYSILGSVQEGP